MNSHSKTKNPINFIESKYEIGKKVTLNFNPCSQYCKCFWTKAKADFLNQNEEYTIEDITYFGGGCPSVLLHLKEIKQTRKSPNTKWWENGLPANWFKLIK